MHGLIEASASEQSSPSALLSRLDDNSPYHSSRSPPTTMRVETDSYLSVKTLYIRLVWQARYSTDLLLHVLLMV
jgi:hypothetical protein